MGSRRRSWGTLKQIRGKNWRASYTGPNGRIYSAPRTFTAKIDGEAWLAAEKRRIDLEDWQPPTTRTAGQDRRRPGLHVRQHPFTIWKFSRIGMYSNE